MLKKGFTPIILVIGILLFTAFGYMSIQYYKITKNDTSKLNSSPTPEKSNGPTDSWQNYSNKTGELSFKYPSDWQLSTQNENGDPQGKNIYIKLSHGQSQIQLYANMIGVGGVGRDYSGIPIKLSGISLFKYKFISQDGQTVIIGITDKLKGSLGIFDADGKTYSFTLSYPSNLDSSEASRNEEVFDVLLSTFKFTAKDSAATATPASCGGIAGLKCPDGYSCKITDTYPDAMGSCVKNAETKFSCPESGWVDCMPGSDNKKAALCSKEALNWYKANCPNFLGAAY